ncbi:MAG: hypothetical protein K0R25_478 [Rickettsiaceae bacterium]|nr:hypothetical protein [Rickettsiaceae bacterium]
MKKILFSLIALLAIQGLLYAQSLTELNMQEQAGASTATATSAALPMIEAAKAVTGQPSKPADKDNVSTAQAVDQIEKTLLFSNPEEANKKSIERRSALNIDRSGSKSSKPKLEILISNPKGNQQNDQKLNTAYNASIAGQYEVAIELYKQVLKSDPNNIYAKFSLAACYQKLGQYKQAKTIYYELLKHDWQDQKTKEELIGNFISVIVEESPMEAVYLLDKLSVENPESAYILAGAAMAYDKIQKPDQAILLLKRAININPNEIKYKFNLAVIYDKISDHKNALHYYQSVINSYVSSDDLDNSIPVAQVRQRIESIRNAN